MKFNIGRFILAFKSYMLCCLIKINFYKVYLIYSYWVRTYGIAKEIANNIYRKVKPT